MFRVPLDVFELLFHVFAANIVLRSGICQYQRLSCKNCILISSADSSQLEASIFWLPKTKTNKRKIMTRYLLVSQTRFQRRCLINQCVLICTIMRLCEKLEPLTGSASFRRFVS